MVTRVSPPEPRDERLLLADAETALRHGLVVAAGVMTRAALEGHLRKLYLVYVRIEIPKRYGIKEMAGQLCHRRVIDKPTQKGLKWAARIGNRCAHNAAVGSFEIFEMVDTVNAFLASHPALEPNSGWTKWVEGNEEPEGGAV